MVLIPIFINIDCCAVKLVLNTYLLPGNCYHDISIQFSVTINCYLMLFDEFSYIVYVSASNRHGWRNKKSAFGSSAVIEQPSQLNLLRPCLLCIHIADITFKLYIPSRMVVQFVTFQAINFFIFFINKLDIYHLENSRLWKLLGRASSLHIAFQYFQPIT